MATLKVGLFPERGTRLDSGYLKPCNGERKMVLTLTIKSGHRWLLAQALPQQAALL